jgi:hypothetical protein
MLLLLVCGWFVFYLSNERETEGSYHSSGKFWFVVAM